MHGIDDVFPLQELIDRSSLAGFDGHRQIWPGGGFFGKALPAFQGGSEFKVSHDASFGIHNHYGVVVFSPIEASVMREVFPVFHMLCFEFMHRGAVMRRSDTRSLAGLCSLRRWDGRRRAGR